MNRVDDGLGDLTERVIGAAIEVHRWFGPGYLEATYQRALAIELELLQIPFQLEAPVALMYKGRSVGDGRIDVLVENRLVLELKATDKPAEIYRRQALLYLEATENRIALIMNFGLPKLTDGIVRVIR